MLGKTEFPNGHTSYNGLDSYIILLGLNDKKLNPIKILIQKRRALKWPGTSHRNQKNDYNKRLANGLCESFLLFWGVGFKGPCGMCFVSFFTCSKVTLCSCSRVFKLSFSRSISASLLANFSAKFLTEPCNIIFDSLRLCIPVIRDADSSFNLLFCSFRCSFN